MAAEVTVGGHGQAHWNTADGLKPLGLDKRGIVKDGYAIYTPLQFSQMRILFDRRHQPTREFVMLKGQVGGDSYDFVDFPNVVPGGHYLLVFNPSVVPGVSNRSEDTLLAYNAFPIDSNGMVLLQKGGNPAEPGIGPVIQPVTMQLSQIAEQLASCH